MLRYLILISVLIIGRIVNGQSEVEGKVIRVREGDLIEILTPAKDTILVKLANIDCPEVGQEYFEEARKYSEKLCLKKTVKLLETGKDNEGNVIGRIILPDREILNIELVEKGLAWHFRKGLQFTVDTSQLIEKEEQAKSSQRGIWSSNEPVAPWIYKRNLTKYEAKTSY